MDGQRLWLSDAGLVKQHFDKSSKYLITFYENQHFSLIETKINQKFSAAELMFGLEDPIFSRVSWRVRGGGGVLIIFLHISFSLVHKCMHTEN